MLRPPTHEQANVINWMILIVLLGSGLFHHSPSMFYRMWVYCFFVAMTLFFTTALLSQKLFARYGVKIQTSPTAQPEHVRQELIDTFWGFGLVVASVAAWPVANATLGIPTAVRPTLAECAPFGTSYAVQIVSYLCKAVAGLLLVDAYNYWKHRAFHTKWLWSFHKTHHYHHNPSAIGGYAVDVCYGFFTFGPAYLFVFPQCGLYLPLHWPLIAFYFLLNHYLHSGYVVPLIERVLRPAYVITSAWHNTHHEKGRPGSDYKDQTFSELFIFWDLLCGTYPKDERHMW